jgi:hypothetical protein
MGAIAQTPHPAFYWRGIFSNGDRKDEIGVASELFNASLLTSSH